MPRKSVKKETASAEPKPEGTTRRSGRSVTKQEPVAVKEASRSRRSSTAAQTAASVADSKSTKGRSSSPSEVRPKTRRESSEPRAKSARRAASRVNYKESDGEEENVDKKVDENFISDEEFEESDSDEKSKPKARGKVSKTPTKARASKGKGKSPRSRRSRSRKHSSEEEEDEEMEPIELSEDSIEIDEEKKPKETTRSGRSRKSKKDESATPEVEEKPKSRRSTRAALRDETPKKRSTRGVQAKKYTEDDDDDIEEIDDKQEEVDESSKKRKRSSTSDSNKRAKVDEGGEEVNDDDDDEHMDVEKADAESKKLDESGDCKDEPMEVESDADKSKAEKSEKEAESKGESSEDKAGESQSEAKVEPARAEESKEKADGMSESSEESKQQLDSKSPKKLDSAVSAAEETKTLDNASGGTDTETNVPISNSVKDSCTDVKDETKADASKEQNSSKKEDTTVLKNDVAEKVQNNVSASSENKTIERENNVPGVITHSKETNSGGLSGSNAPSNKAPTVNSNLTHLEESTPTANGSHEHTNSNSESDQYYPLPGRKYIKNTKLSSNIRQSVKDKEFGFVSYNLGVSSSDSSIQKEKLLSELNKLDAHIICIQEMSKSLYTDVLEPSLDALGFKGTFSQPEGQENGIATFYKSSIFRLSGQSETSLKQLIEKELEASALEPNDRLAVKSHIKHCGHVLFTHFVTVIGTNSLTVANVQVPLTDLSIHALQVSCLAREVVKVNSGTSKPFLLGGEFNMLESEAAYQLLRDGYLNDEMIEELQRRKDVAIPGKENAALVNLLWNSFQHPSSTLCSCYKSILDHEVFIPEQKTTSPDLLWYSSDSLYTLGVVNAPETGKNRSNCSDAESLPAHGLQFRLLLELHVAVYCLCRADEALKRAETAVHVF